jgi:ubiquinone biosynthesis protein UbiJ
MFIKSTIIHSLEIALNQYLSLDENAPQHLVSLSGKIIAITLEPFNETFYLSFSNHTIQCLENYTGKSDTQLSGSIIDFGWMGVSMNPMGLIHSGQIKIRGDLEIGRQFQSLLKNIEVNLEKKLADYIGIKMAHNLSQFFHSRKIETTEFLTSLQLNLTEFLQEESRDLPAKAEADIFYSEVDELRMDYDRLMAKMQRLYHHLNQESA